MSKPESKEITKSIESPVIELEQSSLSAMSLGTGTVLAIGAEMHRTTARILELVADQYRLVAWQESSNSRMNSAANQVRDLLFEFGKQIDRKLWDSDAEAPFTDSADPVLYPPLEHISIVASPRPRLRVWIAALTENNSLSATYGAVEASQAVIVGAVTLNALANPLALAHDMDAAQPDLLVITGGFDTIQNTVQSSLVELTTRLAMALDEIPKESAPQIVFAGNSHAHSRIAAILNAQGQRTVHFAENVLPGPGLTQAQTLSLAIDELYRKQCQHMQDFNRLSDWSTTDGPLLTVESSFARLVQMWMDLNRLPELYGIYAGRNRWLHVWVDAQADRALVRFTPVDDTSFDGVWRPPVRLVSGSWRDGVALPDSVEWLDKRGLAPVISATALASPRAAIDTLRNDIIVQRY